VTTENFARISTGSIWEMRTKFSVVTGDEFLHTVEIEVDGSAFSVRFGDDTRTILKVLDVCTFLKGF